MIRRGPAPSLLHRACGAGVALAWLLGLGMGFGGGLGGGLVLSVSGLFSFPAAAQTAQDPGERLREVQRELKKSATESERLKKRAESLEAEVKALSQRLVSSARDVQDRELQAIILEAKLADLARQEQEKLGELSQNRGQFARVLVALQRLAKLPPEALLAHSGDPADMVRSAILLRSAVPEIERRASDLRVRLAALAETRREAALQRRKLETANEDLARRKKAVAALIAEKRKLRRQTLQESAEARRRHEQFARQARDIRDLMARLAEHERDARKNRARERAAKAQKSLKTAARPKAATNAPKGKAGSLRHARGRLPYPVVGRVVGRYGGTLAEGVTRKGIDIRARAGAQVIAPFRGEVVFAGTFRGYGELLIIEHGGGYHTLLAGVGAIDAEPGQAVAAGEPVATMGSEGARNGAGGAPVLYLELRRNGEPINPLPWLAAGKNRVSG